MQLAPIRRLPLDVPPNPPLAAALPDGSQAPFVLQADAASLTLGPSYSNRVIDLNGREIVDAVFAPGFHHGRFTNGRVGTFRSQRLHSLTPEDPNEVTDLTIDNILCTGRGPHREGNQLRAERCLISDVKTVAASARNAGDGIEAFALWLDPGSKDVLIQDCDLWTWGEEATARRMSTKRTGIYCCSLGSIAEKHVDRVHGVNYINDLEPSQDNWTIDCTFRRKGGMYCSQPDSSSYRQDTVRRLTLKRIRIDMVNDGHPSMNASLQLAQESLTSDGRIRLLGCLIQDLTILSPVAYNPLIGILDIDARHPEFEWTITNANFRRVA